MWEGLLRTLTQNLKRSDQVDPPEYLLSDINAGMTNYATLMSSQSKDDVIQWLVQEVPVEIEEKLLFKPRVGELPKKTQIAVLSWFIKHPQYLSSGDMLHMVKAYKMSPPGDAWLQQLVRLLEVKTEPGQGPSYTFTSQTEIRHAALLERCRRGGRRREKEGQGDESVNKTPSSSASSPKKAESQSQEALASDRQMDVSQMDVSLHPTPATQDTTMSEDASLESKTVLPENIRVQVDALAELWKASESPSGDVPAQIKSFVDCTPAQFELLCQRLCLDSLSEVSLSVACSQLASLGTQLSQQNSLLFAQASLLPRVLGLNQNPSRTLVSAVKTMFEAFPQAVIEGVLVPSLTDSSSAAPQADVMIRIIKEDMTPPNRRNCISKMVLVQQKWSEPIIGVVQTLVDLKTDIDGALLSEIVEKLRQLDSTDSPKEAKLILGLIQKYGKMITVSIGSELKLILQRNTSFVRKPALAALNKLKLELKT